MTSDGDHKIKPTAGSVWQHHSGRLYKVLFLTNIAGDGVKYPHTVVYQGYQNTPPNHWSGPLSDWHRRMSYVGESDRVAKQGDMPEEIFVVLETDNLRDGRMWWRNKTRAHEVRFVRGDLVSGLATDSVSNLSMVAGIRSNSKVTDLLSTISDLVAAKDQEIARLRKELADGSFYKESDIDALVARAETTKADAERSGAHAAYSLIAALIRRGTPMDEILCIAEASEKALYQEDTE